MAAVEEEAAKEAAEAAAAAQSSQRGGVGGPSSHFPQHQFGSSMATPKQETKIFDLAGVTCEPPTQGYSTDVDPTLWNFTCDGATYPARLTNLPCPVELHKTHDHAMYYKCTDVAQMLIVYEDMTALEEAESMPRYKVDGFPSYYHSGLTPPTSRIVEKRFKERVHPPVPPPLHEIQKVEKDLIQLMDSISTRDTSKTKKNPKPALNKVLVEVEEVVVDYEPWMDEGGQVPDGIEFREDQDICKLHPEVWLDPSELKEETKPAEPAAVPASSLPSSSHSKKQKSTTPDAPFNVNLTSDSATTTSSKKKKTKSTDKKRKSKKKKSTPQPVVPDPSLDVSQTPNPDNADSIANLDLIALNMDVLDGFDPDGDGFDMLGLDGMGALDDDLF